MLLLDQVSAGSGLVTATVLRNGEEVDVEAPHLQLPDSQGRSGGHRALAADWRLLRAPLAAGKAEIQCLLRLASSPEKQASHRPPLAPWRGKLHAFVEADDPLPQTHRLEIRHAAISQPPRPALPGHWNAIERVRIDVLTDKAVSIQTPGGSSNLAYAAGASAPRVEVDSLFASYTADPINDGCVFPRGRAGQAWASAETPREHWVVFTWPERKRLSRVYICWGQPDWLPQAYRIECRVNGAFTPVASASEDAQQCRAATNREEEIRFEPVLADALRIVQQAGGGSGSRRTSWASRR